MEHLPTLTGCGIFNSRIHFPGKETTAVRTVTRYELELFTEDGGVCFANGRAYDIRQDTVLFAKPGDKRQSHLHFKALFLHFTMDEPALAAKLNGCPSVFRVSDPERLHRQMRSICDLWLENPEENAVAVTARVLDCLDMLIKEQRLLAQPFAADSMVQTARAFMDHRFHEPLTLAQIAAACHISPIYFHKRYTALTGETPRQFLLTKRIDAARGLLRATELPLSAVAQSCGFSGQAYFSQVFKGVVGQTPGEYRRSLRHPDAPADGQFVEENRGKSV